MTTGYPPAELVQQWMLEAHAKDAPAGTWPSTRILIARAAQWGYDRARAELPRPEPGTPAVLTVRDCNDMRKHRENYLWESHPDEIELDGVFSRADLLEIASTTPPEPGP